METLRPKKRKKSLLEGASKTVRTLAKSKADKQVIEESGMANFKERFQLLGGVRKTT